MKLNEQIDDLVMQVRNEMEALDREIPEQEDKYNTLDEILKNLHCAWSTAFDMENKTPIGGLTDLLNNKA